MECPICLCDHAGTTATLGCCKQVLHIECLIKCMEMKLTCPFCRAEHQSLMTVRESNTIMVVPVERNQHFFRDAFLCVISGAVCMYSLTGVLY